MVALLISFIATLSLDFEQKQNCSTEERFFGGNGFRNLARRIFIPSSLCIRAFPIEEEGEPAFS